MFYAIGRNKHFYIYNKNVEVGDTYDIADRTIEIKAICDIDITVTNTYE